MNFNATEIKRVSTLIATNKAKYPKVVEKAFENIPGYYAFQSNRGSIAVTKLYPINPTVETMATRFSNGKMITQRALNFQDGRVLNHTVKTDKNGEIFESVVYTKLDENGKRVVLTNAIKNGDEFSAKITKSSDYALKQFETTHYGTETDKNTQNQIFKSLLERFNIWPC